MIQRPALVSVLLWCLACSSSPREPSNSAPKETEEPEIQPYLSEAARVTTRLVYFSATEPPTSLGEIAINYGQPKWKPQYDEKFDDLTRNKRWRFGNNFWTSLDTNIELTISKIQVSPGQYYLTIRRSSGDEWYLQLLDPEPVRAKKLDAFFVEEAPTGTEIPLRWRRSGEVAEKLEVKLLPVEDDLDKASLEIHWGAHLLTALIQLLEVKS